ncbi:hypothetical protein AGMMS50230_03570 [Spirochaetia bacterium]|nr:hypothetical protein AGMMS50230_03570 [Spirochaetia bacterium]
MEGSVMEKKKLLLVAVSVGVFLVIVVSAAILVFFRPGASPSPGSGTSVSTNLPASGPSRSATTDPAELIKDDKYQGLQNPAAISPIQENTINIYGESSLIVDSKDQEGATRMKINAPSTAGVPKPVQPAQPAPAKPAAAPAKPAPDPAVVKPAAPVAPKKSYNDFWVQAGSFSTRERADRVKTTLDGKGIAAVITNQDINGSTYYRVRVGPYTSQNEADYWLAMIKSIDGFQNSQVWESQSYR